MKEIELSETEIAKLKANRETVDNLRQKIQKMSQQVQQHQASQGEIIDDITERAEVESIDDVDFSGIDWVNFEGSVTIPEEDG